MRAELEAKIAELEAALEAERKKLATLVQTIPQEFHHITREVWDRLKGLFE